MNAPQRPFPSPFQAALLTLMGSFFAGAVFLVSADWLSPTSALGLGTAVGFGVAGVLGAASVPRPHGVRVGLRGIEPRHLLAVALLVPSVFLAREVGNWVAVLMPAPDAAEVAQEITENLPTDTQLALVETAVVAVGLVPVVEEWFFRGVIQQGLVATAGVRGGIYLTALLFAVGHGGPGISPQAWAGLVAQMLVLGLVLGWARHATGSVLAPILLHVAVNGLGVVTLALPGKLAIAGYDVPGAHLPVALLVPSFAAVSVGAWLLSREHPEPAPPIPLSTEPED
jgi:sodium transport system permease protein